ncbi:MAG: response regulator [Anaerolineaceae bacterium]|jgi:pilus assembly protein CpaE|nr:response regulator [Anaerolineaceae bacterium]
MPPRQTIRVLIVDDIDETRENIRRLLQFDSNIEIAGIAKDGKEALSVASKIDPDVIIMDINMPDMDGITATEAIRQKNPFSQVVILSVQGDQNYMRRAMMAGARDYLTKPPSIDELTSAINRAGKMSHEAREKASAAFSVAADGSGTAMGGVPVAQSNIIVIYSGKGGCGCTTLATNLALALTLGRKSPNEKILLVDGSMQYGDVAVFLNEQVRNSITELASRVDDLDIEVIEDVITKHSISDLHILAAPPRPELADSVTAEQFGKLLQYLRKIYKYIVVDTSSYLTGAVMAALDEADLILLLTSQSIPSIKNANYFFNLSDASGIPRNRIMFILNKYDKKIAISPERIGESLRQEIAAVIPYDDKVVDNAINQGKPFILENRTLPVSKSIIEIAEKIPEKILANSQKDEA